MNLSLRFSCLPVLFFILSLVAPSPAPAASAAEAKRATEVTFNFVDVDLAAVTKFISDITGKNFIFDEKVKGKVTIIAPTKLSIDNAYSLFTSVLELKGYTVVPSGVDAYKIVPAAEAKQQGLRVATNGVPVNEGSIARLITLKHISAEEAMRFLQPLVAKDGHISTFGPGNLVLVVDSGLNIEKIMGIVDIIDRPAATDLPEVVPLKHASADTVARMLNDGFGRGRPRTGAQPQTETATAIADQRLNAVVLFGDRGARESMKALVAIVDRPSPEAQGRINVYFLENADATELAKVLEGILKGMQASRQAAPAAAPAAQVSPFEAAGGITITPDKSTNSLVVVASPADYVNILQIIKQLDRRRRQVFVEAMIVEASIDKLRELGAKWRVVGERNGEPIVIGGVGRMDPETLQNVVTGLTGATVGGMGNFLNVPIFSTGPDGTPVQTTLNVPGFAALFSLNDFRDVINVLSTPQLLTSDNKEAEIMVGENVPFISKRERDVTTTNTVLNSIERQDVGIKLRITPQITEGDYIKLEIYQEISAVKQESQEIIINVGPSTTKRSTKTSVVVKDNQTVVIGGLMQEREEENVTKMPVLGDIPVLGYLFKQKSLSKTKTNLLVFLTPHVVKDADQLQGLTREKQMEFAAASAGQIRGEVLVSFKEGVTDEQARAIIEQLGASVMRVIQGLRLYQVRLKEDQSVEEALGILRAFPEVNYAEPNYTRRMH